jgi:hypothetical protein
VGAIREESSNIAGAPRPIWARQSDPINLPLLLSVALEYGLLFVYSTVMNREVVHPIVQPPGILCVLQLVGLLD